MWNIKKKKKHLSSFHKDPKASIVVLMRGKLLAGPRLGLNANAWKGQLISHSPFTGFNKVPRLCSLKIMDAPLYAKTVMIFMPHTRNNNKENKNNKQDVNKKRTEFFQ